MFASKDVLRDDYRPDELLGRDEEKEEFVHGLAPIVNAEQPNNVFLYGKTGVGKTLATRFIIDELCEDTANITAVDVRTVWVNCKDKTSYNTAVAIVNQLRDSEDQIPEQRHSESAVHNMLWSELDTLDATHVLFILDEVDSLGTDDELLYQIPRARTNGYVDDVKLGIIGTCDNFNFRENLSARVRSTLAETEIHFAPYDAAELRAILKQRATEAFESGALTDDVVPLTAALVTSNTGSARRAIDILRTAGENAQKADAEQVTEEHVRVAQEEVEEEIIKSELTSFSNHALLSLYAVAVLEMDRSVDEVRIKTVAQMYRRFCDAVEMDSRTTRTVQNHLSEMALMGFLTSTECNKGKGGGKFLVHELSVDPQAVKSAISEVDRFDGLVE